MDLASFFIDRKDIKFCRLQDKIVEWENKGFECKSFCTPPNPNAIDFGTFFYELSYRKHLFNQSFTEDYIPTSYIFIGVEMK
jgi:hypothetical protein